MQSAAFSYAESRGKIYVPHKNWAQAQGFLYCPEVHLILKSVFAENKNRRCFYFYFFALMKRKGATISWPRWQHISMSIRFKIRHTREDNSPSGFQRRKILGKENVTIGGEEQTHTHIVKIELKFWGQIFISENIKMFPKKPSSHSLNVRYKPMECFVSTSSFFEMSNYETIKCFLLKSKTRDSEYFGANVSYASLFFNSISFQPKWAVGFM